MPILQDDIKLLKSAVMADTTDGGGAMTGVEVIDGQSNNLFPDTSAVDRAFGRVSMRQIYGVAHTDDTDTMLGAHAIITKAPADPLVACALMQTGGWADTRVVAREKVEKYLVKGAKIAPVLYDTHYAGSTQIKLVSLVSVTFPAGGDALVLRNPNGQEQYVRILRGTQSTQTVAVVNTQGEMVAATAQVMTCELGQELRYDFLGPPVGSISPASYAQVYGTNPSAGAKFYGIKPLAAPGAINDLSVTVSGGIYTPLVPAATVESPIIDQYPLLARASLSRTGLDEITLPQVNMGWVGGAVYHAPTPITPRSVSLLVGANTIYTDDGAGKLLQGTLVVGTVDYRGKMIAMNADAPPYGSAAVILTYMPATPSGAATHSVYTTVTFANQGRAYTQAFEPPPAPGTFFLSYMVQGRWYEQLDNGDGKLAGVDTSHGIGTINYNTGSMATTLGAIPDIGSPIIYQWGDAATAVAVAPAGLPAKVQAALYLDIRAMASTITVDWLSSGAARSATMGSGGLTGDATGSYTAGTLTFEPNYMPDGDVTIGYQRGATSSTGLGDAGGVLSLQLAPVAPKSVRFDMLTVAQSGFDIPSVLSCFDNGAGLLLSATGSPAGFAVGTINYTTGVVTFQSTVSMAIYENVVQPYGNGNAAFFEKKVLRNNHTVTLIEPTSVAHTQSGTTTVPALVVTPTWRMQVPVSTGLALKTDALAFTHNGNLFTAVGGVLRRGWVANTGLPVAAAVGAVTSAGLVTFTGALTGFGNQVTWFNAAQDKASGVVSGGIFRTASAPLKSGVFQIQSGSQVGAADDGGLISGDNWGGTVDYARGVVKWTRAQAYVEGNTYASWVAAGPLAADTLGYNAVFLQYLPLDVDLLGLDTARLPLDGKVPVFRTGDLVVVHNTLSTALPDPLTKGLAYNLGRQRIASVRVKDLLGVTVPSTLYTTDLDAGTITVPTGSNIAAYSQPFTVQHRIEDMLLCSSVDISGQLKFTRSLTHVFPAGTSFVSSALVFGDMFARAYGIFEQQTWTQEWSDEPIGNAILAQYNAAQYPIVVTNRGSITQRWALIFTSSNSFRVVGETVGEIGTGNTATTLAIGNPATQVPYFTLPALGWGNGWAAGTVLRFNTDACGAPFWPVRTVLQGPATLQSDQFEIALRCDVDRP